MNTEPWVEVYCPKCDIPVRIPHDIFVRLPLRPTKMVPLALVKVVEAALTEYINCCGSEAEDRLINAVDRAVAAGEGSDICTRCLGKRAAPIPSGKLTGGPCRRCRGTGRTMPVIDPLPHPCIHCRGTGRDTDQGPTEVPVVARLDISELVTVLSFYANRDNYHRDQGDGWAISGDGFGGRARRLLATIAEQVGDGPADQSTAKEST